MRLRTNIISYLVFGLIIPSSAYDLQAAYTARIAAKIAFTTTGASQAPFYLAKELGLFQKHGLDVETIYAPGNTAMRALVATKLRAVIPTSSAR